MKSDTELEALMRRVMDDKAQIKADGIEMVRWAVKDNRVQVGVLGGDLDQARRYFENRYGRGLFTVVQREQLYVLPPLPVDPPIDVS